MQIDFLVSDIDLNMKSEIEGARDFTLAQQKVRDFCNNVDKNVGAF